MHEGLIDPDDQTLMNSDEHKLLIFDDVYNTVAESAKMCLLQTFSARKANISTIITTYVFIMSMFADIIAGRKRFYTLNRKNMNLPYSIDMY